MIALVRLLENSHKGQQRGDQSRDTCDDNDRACQAGACSSTSGSHDVNSRQTRIYSRVLPTAICLIPQRRDKTWCSTGREKLEKCWGLEGGGMTIFA